MTKKHPTHREWVLERTPKPLQAPILWLLDQNPTDAQWKKLTRTDWNGFATIYPTDLLLELYDLTAPVQTWPDCALVRELPEAWLLKPYDIPVPDLLVERIQDDAVLAGYIIKIHDRAHAQGMDTARKQLRDALGL